MGVIKMQPEIKLVHSFALLAKTRKNRPVNTSTICRVSLGPYMVFARML